MARVRKYKHRSVTAHDFNREPELEGVITKFDELEVDKEMRRYCVVDTGHTTPMVFESHALKEVFEQGEEGDHVHIVFHGKKKLSGKKSFNKFSVELWTEEEGEEDDEETRSDTEG